MGTVFVAATRSGDRIVELVGTGRKYSYILNDPGAAEITVPLDKYQRHQLDPGAVELHVYRDGLCVWAGPIWGARADTGSGTLSITAAGLESYFEGQRLKTTLSYDGISQGTIWADLLEQEAASWNLTVDEPIHGGTFRTFVGEEAFHAYQRLDIAQKVEELASLPDGFDWEVTPSDRTARFFLRQGVESEQVLELGRNLDHIEVEVNARTVETVVDIYGSGEGSAMPVVTVSAAAEIARYGRRHGVGADKTAISRTALLERGLARIARRARASEVPRLVMLPGVEPTFGQVGKGDTVEVRASRGWVQMTGSYRIVAIEVSVDDSGLEQVAYIPADPVEVESDVA